MGAVDTNTTAINSGNEQVAGTNSSTHAAEGFLNAVADQAKGKTVIDTQQYENVIHEAGDWTEGQKEQFLKTLSAKYVDTIYTDAEWTDKWNDLYYQDSEQFGSIVQIINTEMPEVRENRAWDEITSGVTTIGSNVVYLPVAKEQLTGGTTSWAIPYALTGQQMNTAFESAAGLKRFENQVIMQADNAGRYHVARMSATNRNNYILEKLAAGNVAGKMNYVNLVEEYCRMTGKTSMTKQAFLNNTDGCLRMVVRIYKKYRALLTDMTTLFTMDTTSNGKFIPESRFAFTTIADFAALLEAELYSTTYHDEFVKLKGYREIPSWQGIRSNSTTATFDDLSTIDASRVSDDKAYSVVDTSTFTNYTGAIDMSGIVSLMVDRWAIMHTTVRRRTGVQRDDIKDITLYEHQFTDRYVNNLMLNGLVFIVADYGT